jgi:hypothetical protein
MLEIRVAVFCEVVVVDRGAEAFPEIGVLDDHRGRNVRVGGGLFDVARGMLEERGG